MKVLHIAETAKGGVGTIINGLCTLENIESYVLVPFEHKEFINVKPSNLFSFSRGRRGVKSLLNLLVSSYKTIKKLNPDVIHLHSTFAGLVVRFFNLSSITASNVRVVYTPHAFSFLMDGSKFKKRVYGVIEKKLLSRTDVLVCNSFYEKKEAEKYGITGGKVKVIYNGVVDGDCKVSNGCSNNDETRVQVLFIGRFDYQKGFDYMLDIIRKSDCNEFCFHIIGDYVVSKNENIEVKDNVRFYGWLNKDEIESVISYCDLLIVPSRWESFGLVAVEAQSYGLAVIANNNSSLPEVVHNVLPNKLLDFSNKDEVSSYIKGKDKFYWGGNKEERIRFVKKNFLISDMLRLYETEYKEDVLL